MKGEKVQLIPDSAVGKSLQASLWSRGLGGFCLHLEQLQLRRS
jgi:hypothetical protein